MYRLSMLLLLSAFLAIPTTPALRAQNEAGPSPASATTADLSLPPWPSSTIRDAAASRTHASWVHRLVMGAGAAVLGAWVGYMSSQVARGDWAADKGSIRRGLWTGAGSALGFSLGFALATGSRHAGQKVSSPLPALPPHLPVGRSVITAKEIAGSSASTAYDVVRNLRPEWLVEQRQAHTWREMVVGPDLPVYLDSELLGGIDQLSTVSAQDIKAMYRLDAGQATARWGGGHMNGAILIVTKN